MRNARWNSGLASAALATLLAGAAAGACGQARITAEAAPPSSAAAPSSLAASPSSPPAALQGPLVVLDHVVAVVNGDVILESDVEEEMRIAALQPIREDPTANTAEAALSRLIDRDLILEQMKSSQALLPTDQQIDQQIAGLRKQIPDCVEFRCETEAGWRALLAAHGLTEEEVSASWRQRMAILSFIQSRFGAGVRVSRPEIEEYYKEEFAPEFAKRGLQAPPLEAVSSRIQEVLLQRKVNGLLQDWLQSLKENGSVMILSSGEGPAGEGRAGSAGADDASRGEQR